MRSGPDLRGRFCFFSPPFTRDHHHASPQETLVDRTGRLPHHHPVGGIPRGGPVLLPYILKRYIETHSEAWIDRKVTIDRIVLNPFTFRYAITGVTCYEPKSEEVFVSWKEHQRAQQPLERVSKRTTGASPACGSRRRISTSCRTAIASTSAT
jgi:hypothetical protein